MIIYNLFDRVAGKHLPLWLAENDDTARRALKGALESDQNLSKNHQDYDVFSLGDFDHSTGIIVPHRKHCFTLTSCKTPEA